MSGFHFLTANCQNAIMFIAMSPSQMQWPK